MRTGDQSLIKELNRSITLNLLRLHSPISRAQISTLTGLNKATVSAIIEDLLREGLVTEVGRGHSTVGRRPVMLMFNSKAGYSIGVDFGVNYIRILIMDLSGNIILVREISIIQTNDMQQVTSTLVNLINEIIAQTPKSILGILGVGIGVPGFVDFANGIVLNAPNLQWRDVQLKALLEAQIHLPFLIDNEANAGALAENLFGIGRNVPNFIYISAGTGIGTGIIVNNHLFRGSEGIAGEFGHMTIEVEGLRCPCGNRGCFEMYASEKALTTKYSQITGKNCSVEEILAKLFEGETAAIESMLCIGQYLGIGITNMINGLNPSLVVIGNRLAEAKEWILQPVEQKVRNRCPIMSYSKVNICASSLGRNATAIGAAALVLNEFFTGPQTDSTL
ncbi:ROK family transcriptional regulator [Fodinisporobacter ferrooxydans]|uniref:ROK family transcriptional regulator n=1 Tax=Fodinisporobacter ferrooxydans TaxID=2901836 RepID=A0ABY4CHH1_9BACL|nr:ROK family transcriptional regulator [Alicyclobacillaceae bacterium MYW30-H2]